MQKTLVWRARRQPTARIRLLSRPGSIRDSSGWPCDCSRSCRPALRQGPSPRGCGHTGRTGCGTSVGSCAAQSLHRDRDRHPTSRVGALKASATVANQRVDGVGPQAVRARLHCWRYPFTPAPRKPKAFGQPYSSSMLAEFVDQRFGVHLHCWRDHFRDIRKMVRHCWRVGLGQGCAAIPVWLWAHGPAGSACDPVKRRAAISHLRDSLNAFVAIVAAERAG